MSCSTLKSTIFRFFARFKKPFVIDLRFENALAVKPNFDILKMMGSTFAKDKEFMFYGFVEAVVNNQYIVENYLQKEKFML